MRLSASSLERSLSRWRCELVTSLPGVGDSLANNCRSRGGMMQPHGNGASIVEQRDSNIANRPFIAAQRVQGD